MSVKGTNPDFEVAASLLEKWEPQWKPLRNGDKKVLMWDYRTRERIPVVYRFVIAKDREIFTIYVGSGCNLSYKSGVPLVKQYRSGQHAKKIIWDILVETEIFKKRGYEAWTEIIEIDEETKRLLTENLAICKYWIEYLRKSDSETPKFLNKRIEKLPEINDYIKALGLLE